MLENTNVPENTKKPVFHNIALGFNVLAILSLVYLYGGFHKGQDGMEGMFDGVQFIVFALVGLAVGFVCAVIGYNRKERLNLITKINSGLSMIMAVVIFMVWRS